MRSGWESAMDKVDALLNQWVGGGLLPGGILHISIRNRRLFSKSYGSYSDGGTTRAIHNDTLLDIASLTKVTATLPSILLLVHEQKLSLDRPLSYYMPEFLHPEVTVRHLLMHASGLPADLPVHPRHSQRPRLMEEILERRLDYEPGEGMRYSDLGMILLGVLIERLSGEPLDRFAKRHIFDCLSMNHTMFNPGAELAPRIAATEKVDGAYIVGHVHDEKCYHLGGVSGSAGLFSTAEDLSRYADWWLEPEHSGILPRGLMQEAVTRPIRGRGLGWEVWHDPLFPTSCAASWPLGSFGHTGFTGTSLWLEPSQGLSVVFLTNAVHYGRQNRIRELRPILHETVWSSYFS